jgi:hypothetical protein
LSKILLTKKTSVIFLATVLVAGMIALSSPSFMVGAQAEVEYVMDPKYNSHEPDYGMDSYDDKKSYGKDNYKSTDYPSYGKDNSYYKSKDSSSVKCNNINVNLNGFNGIGVNAVPPALNGLATAEAQAANEGEVGASSLGSGERNDNGYQHNDKNFRFVCIDNNDFTVVEEEEPIPPIPPGPTPEEDCADCFATTLDGPVFDQLEAELGDIGGITFPIGPGISIEINSLVEFCEIVEALGLTGEDLRFFVVDLLAFAGITITVDEQTELVECISDALFPDSINGLG